MSEPLLNCPFCGANAIIISSSHDDGTPYSYVECCDCAGQNGTLAEWNQRPEPQPVAPFAEFGRLVFRELHDDDFFGDEWSEKIMPLAVKAGVAERTKYDPEKHGEDVEAEPGQEIWLWRDESEIAVAPSQREAELETVKKHGMVAGCSRHNRLGIEISAGKDFECPCCLAEERDHLRSRVANLEEQQENWRVSSVARGLAMERDKLRELVAELEASGNERIRYAVECRKEADKLRALVGELVEPLKTIAGTPADGPSSVPVDSRTLLQIVEALARAKEAQ